MSAGFWLGWAAGLALGLVVALSVPAIRDSNFLQYLVGFSLSTFGGMVGRKAYDQ